jgi:hypothetical protein
MLFLSLAPSFFSPTVYTDLYGLPKPVWKQAARFSAIILFFSFSKNSVRHGAGVFVFTRLLWGTVLSLTIHPA